MVLSTKWNIPEKEIGEQEQWEKIKNLILDSSSWNVYSHQKVDVSRMQVYLDSRAQKRSQSRRSKLGSHRHIQTINKITGAAAIADRKYRGWREEGLHSKVGQEDWEGEAMGWEVTKDAGRDG